MRTFVLRVLLATTLLTCSAGAFSQAVLQTSLAFLNGYPSGSPNAAIVYSNQATLSVSTFNINVGNAAMAAGDSVALMISVDGDAPTRVLTRSAPLPLFPITQPQNNSTGTNTIRLDNFAYPLNQARFGGGGGIVHDITIWPTKVAGPGTTPVLVGNVLHVPVLYVDAAAFRINNSAVTGLPPVVLFDHKYSNVNMRASNFGVAASTAPLEYYVQLDNLPPARIMDTAFNVQVPVYNFYIATFDISLSDYYLMYAFMDPSFPYVMHSARIYATEQGKQNFIQVANYMVDASGLAVLPVELLGFEGAPAGNAIELRWFTGAEEDLSHFLLEKYNPLLGDFETLTSQNALGSLSQGASYAYTDQLPVEGSNRYRLRQVNPDGHARVVGRELEIMFSADQTTAVLQEAYPNPCGEHFSLRVYLPKEMPLECTVTDLSGKVLRRENYAVMAGTQDLRVNMQSLPAGIYLYRLQAGAQAISGKILRR